MPPHFLRSLAGAALLAGSSLLAQPCLVAYTFTSSPLPTGGTYGCGETVTFCFTVTNWNSTNTNWFQGLEVNLGPGWDLSTLVPGAPPATCGGSGGTWGWYNSVTGTATTNIGPQGPGFFFDLNNDGNPGNNFGDFCVGAVNWQFCWTVSVLSPPDCVNGLDLGVSVNTFGDSETGSWSSAGCNGDAVATSPPAVILACTVSAGIGAPLDLCTSSPATDLSLSLGGTPTPGGVWTDPSGAFHSGTFDPSADVSGNYTYTVTSLAPPCSSQAIIAVALQQQPDAGTNGGITTCASDAAFSLFALLGGTPDPGGTWTDPSGGATTGSFDPSVSSAGIYLYDIPGTAPCVSAQASVTVTVNPSPNAGTDGTLSICSNGSPTDLFSLLGGAPAPGGVWTEPIGAVVGSVYSPAGYSPGIYTYTVAGIAPCPNSSATVTVTENTMPMAGVNTTAYLCETDNIVSGIDLLGGSPDAGGSWTGPGGSPIGGTIDPATSPSGDYLYTVAGVAPCPDAYGTLTLDISQQPDAGSDAVVNLCDGSPDLDMITALGGNPEPGGVWTDSGGGIATPVFVVGVGQPGSFTYSLPPTTSCPGAAATLTIIVSPGSNAGVDAVTDVCSSAAAFPLLPLLGPDAQASGSWIAPDGGASSGTFTPGISLDGLYTYTIVGIAPCTTISATVTVSTVTASDPGSDGDLTVCITGPVEDLFASLNGTPTPGGVWTTPSGAPFGGLLNPGTSTSGVYVYTLPAAGPCPAQSATVDVTIEATPNAGQDGAVGLCGSGTQYALISGLGGSPAANGTWTDPSGQAHGANFDPSTDVAGIYTYTIYAPPPCVSASSELTVAVEQPVNAGVGGFVSLCENGVAVDPSDWLSGNPDAGGSWTAPGGAPIAMIDPSTAASGAYTYTVQATAPCPDAQAIVTLTIDALPYAGTDASLTLCDEAAPAVLINWLIGAQSGGSWTGPSGAATGVFAPGVNIPGAYTYTVDGSGACADEQDQGTVDVSVLPLPTPTFTVSAMQGCVPMQVEFTIDDATGLQSAGWIFGDGTTGDALAESWHTYTTAGTFTVQLEVTNSDGCVGYATITDAITVSQGPGAMFYALPLRVSVSSPTTEVTQVPEPGILYSWTIDTSLVDTSGTFSWTFDPPEIGPHPICLTASDALGCSNTYCIDVIVDDDLTIYVANAFTPNGDGRNDSFRPSIIGVQQDWYEFMVFDRWGMLIFSSGDPYQAWNGGMNNSGDVLTQDVYVWKLRAKDQFTPEKQEFIGSVTLLK